MSAERVESTGGDPDHSSKRGLVPLLVAGLVLATWTGGMVWIMKSIVPSFTASSEPFLPVNAPEAPDYSLGSSWAALPWRSDNADIVPAGCGSDKQGVSSVDTFFLHPTSFMDPTTSKWNAPLDDYLANFLTDVGQMQQQASAFNGASNVFAPRYRQCSMWSQSSEAQWNTWPGNPYNNSLLQQAMDIAFSDVVHAFDHFLEHWNEARPIVLAGHSQGTMQLKRLISAIDAKEKYALVRERIVAAYLIGNTVEVSEMPRWLPLCVHPNQTRCYVSWNTLREGANATHWLAKLRGWDGPHSVAGHNKSTAAGVRAACVNPLSWTNSTSQAPKYLHLGGMVGPRCHDTSNTCNFCLHSTVPLYCLLAPRTTRPQVQIQLEHKKGPLETTSTSRTRN